MLLWWRTMFCNTTRLGQVSQPFLDLHASLALCPEQSTEICLFSTRLDPNKTNEYALHGTQKYRAGVCMCRSCRLAVGIPIVAWAWVPEEHILKPDGSPAGRDTWGTLQRLESSPGIFRDFCGKCGASVFYYDTKRPVVTDISPALFRDHDGALAPNWCQWRTDIWPREGEDVFWDRDLYELVSGGMKNLDELQKEHADL